MGRTRQEWMAAIARRLAAGVAMVVAAGLPIALAPGAAWAQGKDLDGVVNLNTAAPDLLELLPGIGPAKVRSILTYRQRRPFRTVDELVRIKGVGRKMVRRLRAHLAVSGPSTARAVHRARDDSEPASPVPAPPPAPVPKKPPALVGRVTAPGAPPRRPSGPPLPLIHARARSVHAAEAEPRRSAADHCARPP